MKNIIKMLVLSLVLGISAISWGQNQSPVNQQATAKLDKIDQLTIENAFLKTQLDGIKASVAKDAFDKDKLDLTDNIKNLEAKYHARFDATAGVFILLPVDKTPVPLTPHK